MGESKRWELRRYVTLLLVLALHAGLFAVLVTVSSSPGRPNSEPRPIEVLLLPPTALPKIRSENLRAHPLSGGTARSLAPPELPDLPTASSPNAGSEGNGRGVDWTAEARRALQAFEIRNGRQARTIADPRPPAEDTWWPPTQHHAGERYKTAAGDWIVWIDSNCYQIAAAASPYAANAVPSQTICGREPGAPAPPAR